MELKFEFDNITHISSEGSNRTFMELKLLTDNKVAKRGLSSNRTFMELKCDKSDSELISSVVLIAPLWN